MKIKSILIALFFILLFSNSSFAASYPNGSAVYRDGGYLNAYRHAGIMKNSSTVYEIKGPGYEVNEYSLTSFKDGKTYYGTYAPPSLSSSQRDSILETAEALDNDPEITYTAADQLAHISNPGTYVSVYEITDIRCDGVVEYAYEWNNVDVWGKTEDGLASGTPYYFDISYTSYVPYHANLGSDQPWVEVSPKVQMAAADVDVYPPTKYTTFRKGY